MTDDDRVVIAWLIFVVMILLSGCSQTNLAAILEAAGKDPATVCGSATYAGAQLQFARTNLTQGEVTCNGNGMSVRSIPSATPIGVKVTPVQ